MILEEDEVEVIYQIQGSSRQCARTGRALQPGEWIYSVLYERDGQWVREDISADAWTGPPEQAFSFWKTRVAPAAAAAKPALNLELLWDCFERSSASQEPRQIAFRYVLALLLMRRKRLRFEAIQRDEKGSWLVLREARTKQVHQVFDPQLSEDQTSEVQAEIESLLGTT